MTTVLDQMIDERLFNLSVHEEWIVRMLDDLDNDIVIPQVSTVSSLPRVVEVDSSESDSDDDDPFELEDFPDSDSDMTNDDLSTVLYHTDMWGFHPRSRALSYDEEDDDFYLSDDDETVVAPWEDPYQTPCRGFAADMDFDD